MAEGKWVRKLTGDVEAGRFKREAEMGTQTKC